MGGGGGCKGHPRRDVRRGQDSPVIAHRQGGLPAGFVDVVDEYDGGELLRATHALVLPARLSRWASLAVVTTRSLMVVDQVRPQPTVEG